jgi:GNAT superfamily N-acetyltransferase
MLRPSRAVGAPVEEGHVPRAPDVSEHAAGSGGEVTHMVVDASRRRSGAGRALVDAASDLARQYGLSYMELVTVPGSGAAAFYERLGWEGAGELSTSSGEHFVRYRLAL